MISTYTIKGKNNELTYKEEQSFKRSCIEETIKHPYFKAIKGEANEILLNGVKICIRNSEQEMPISINVEHSLPFHKIHFELEGKSEYMPKNNESLPVIIDGGCYNFFYLPKVKGVLTYPKNKRKSLEITFTEEFIKSIFKDSFDSVSSDFGMALKNKTPYKMFNNCQSIPPRLLLIINDIINCTYQKEIKEVYLTSKLTEIFSYLFSEIKEKKKTSAIKRLRKQEYKDILKAEGIITQNLQNPPTIEQLSIQTGINQFKLKTHFKEVFKQPIFTYITNLRMEKAKKMLVKDDLTVSEVAYAVGYKNPQHFTVAFKKKFNFLPSSLKN